MTVVGFVDPEDLVRQWIATTFTATRAGLETPTNLADLPSFTLVRRIGGPVLGVRTEMATLDIESFAPDRQTAKDNARALQWAIEHVAPAPIVTLADGSAGVIVATACTSGPSWRPYTDPNVFLYAATYSVTVQTTA